MELSSFQLELMSSSTQIAALLNITPNHLDRHKSMEAYAEAKVRILRNQSTEDIAVLNRDDPVTWGMKGIVKGKLFTFGMKKCSDFDGTYIREGNIYLQKEGTESCLVEIEAIALVD